MSPTWSERYHVIERIRQHPVAHAGAISIALLLLSLITGFSQIKTEGLAWQEAHYLPVLESVVAGEAPAPDQYRVLTSHIVVAACRVAEAAGLPRPVGLTFVALRLLQNLTLFALAFYYYRRLGVQAYASLLGLSALAWGMTQSNYGADLSFDTYTDIVCFLAAALVLMHGRFHWLIPLTVLAALNRETSVFLFLMAVAWSLPRFGVTTHAGELRRIAVIVLVLFGSVQLAVRLYYGWPPWTIPPAGAAPGLALLRYNLGGDAAWGHAAGTLGIVPVLALAAYRQWQPALRPLFWAVVPAWSVLCLCCTPLDQSRVLLLPLVLVLVPGMLCGLGAFRDVRDHRELTA